MWTAKAQVRAYASAKFDQGLFYPLICLTLWLFKQTTGWVLVYELPVRTYEQYIFVSSLHGSFSNQDNNYDNASFRMSFQVPIY